MTVNKLLILLFGKLISQKMVKIFGKVHGGMEGQGGT